MKAAVVRELGSSPQWSDFPDPTLAPGEVLISVDAAAVNPIVLTRASGAHYSSDARVPFVAGLDGVGTTSDGRRVYFRGVRPPYGSLAERVAIPPERTIPLPDGLGETVAAAAAIPGASAWIPLTRLSPIRSGESVLVNGATGSAGRMAIQVARRLGAKSIIATGRDPAKLRSLSSLGADRVEGFGGTWEPFRARIRELAKEANLGIVIDYLWGPSAEAIVSALGGPDAPRGNARVRFVSVGSMAGPTVALASTALRSSGLEILGSGIGASSEAEIREGTREFLTALATDRFRVETEELPMASVDQNWGRTGGERRLVFTQI